MLNITPIVATHRKMGWTWSLVKVLTEVAQCNDRRQRLALCPDTVAKRACFLRFMRYQINGFGQSGI